MARREYLGELWGFMKAARSGGCCRLWRDAGGGSALDICSRLGTGAVYLHVVLGGRGGLPGPLFSYDHGSVSA